MKRKILVIDVGGTNVKLMISRREKRKFRSGLKLTPRVIAAEIKPLISDWKFDVISMGFPAPVRDGRILNDQFSTYIIPTTLDTPDIEAILVESEFPWGPYGAKGLGETPIIGVAPAVTAAIHHATGVRLSEIPATPERVWTALRRGAVPPR